MVDFNDRNTNSLTGNILGEDGKVYNIVTLLQNIAANSGGTSEVTWADVQDKPTSFTPSAHTHEISDVTDLQGALDGKADNSDLTWANISSKPTTFAPSTHTHTIAQVTGLQDALDGKEGTIDASGLTTIADPTTATTEDIANAVNSIINLLKS